MKLTWYPAGTREPLDERTDLMAGYWAVIGPKAEGRFGWMVVGPDGEDVTSGNADDASAAKVAVEQWFSQSVDYSTGRTSTPPTGWEA